ncbi:MAG: hypothetical protein ACOCR6_02055 [archaeon]
MATPTSMLAFIIANIIVWPSIALTYWYVFQLEEESIMNDLASAAGTDSTGQEDTDSGAPEIQ